MPKEPCPGLLLTLVLSLLLLYGPSSSNSIGAAATSVSSQHPVCKPGLEFWSTERNSCWPCTKCAPEFTLSPCALHKDAICGPLSALELDWSFLSTKKRQENGQHRRFEAVTSKMLWRFPDVVDQQEQDVRQETRNFLDDDGGDVDNDDRRGNVEESSDSQKHKRLQQHLRAMRQSSVNDNAISWDWQTAALVLAVCACIVFFLVAGCSALVYARQWRQMKKNFEPAGLEEISARLNVMVKAELAELVAGAPMNPGDPETRCQYLEKLLDRKRETPVVANWPEVGGNLYVEEGETPRSKKRSQIARIHRNIETILSHNKTSD